MTLIDFAMFLVVFLFLCAVMDSGVSVCGLSSFGSSFCGVASGAISTLSIFFADGR